MRIGYTYRSTDLISSTVTVYFSTAVHGYCTTSTNVLYLRLSVMTQITRKQNDRVLKNDTVDAGVQIYRTEYCDLYSVSSNVRLDIGAPRVSKNFQPTFCESRRNSQHQNSAGARAQPGAAAVTCKPYGHTVYVYI